jgi:hypothetical protein
MLRYKLPSLRDKKPYTIPTLVPKTPDVTPVESPPLKQGMMPTMMNEAIRREKIVEKLAKECPYKEHDIVTPVDDEEVAKYGKNILVEKICKSYTEIGLSEKWPASDLPLIVMAWSQEKQTRFFCTTNYLKKL